MLTERADHHLKQKSAALFGSFASAASMQTAIQSGLDTFTFNLSIHRWPDWESPPDYWWITEEKIFLECEHLNFFGGDSSTNKCRILLPKQLGKWKKLFFSGNVEKIQLNHFEPRPHSTPLELQAAALWHTSQRGYRNIYCLGFDHFLLSGNPPVFRKDFLPRFSKLQSWDPCVSEKMGDISKVRFVSSENLRNPSYDWLMDCNSSQSLDFLLSIKPVKKVPSFLRKIHHLFRKSLFS